MHWAPSSENRCVLTEMRLPRKHCLTPHSKSSTSDLSLVTFIFHLSLIETTNNKAALYQGLGSLYPRPACQIRLQSNQQGRKSGRPAHLSGQPAYQPSYISSHCSLSLNCLFCRSNFERLVEGNEYFVSVTRRLSRTGISCPSSSVCDLFMILLCPPLIVLNRVRKIVGWFIIQAACCHSLRLRHRCIHLVATSRTYIELNGSKSF